MKTTNQTNKKARYQIVVSPSVLMLGEVEHDITVKSINGKFHCRLFTNGIINQEAICYDRADISYTIRNLLRTEDKIGNYSDFATSARKRLNNMFKKQDSAATPASPLSKSTASAQTKAGTTKQKLKQPAPTIAPVKSKLNNPVAPSAPVKSKFNQAAQAPVKPKLAQSKPIKAKPVKPRSP